AESGVSFPAQGAFMAAALCFVTVIINYFGDWQWVPMVAATVVLGAVAHVLYALVLYGCVKYLKHQWLTTVAMGYILVAAVYSAVAAALVLAKLIADPTFQTVLQVASVAAAAILLYVITGASAALKRAQQG